MNERERLLRKKCRDNFPYYAEKTLKIRTKKKGLLPFVLNEAQVYVHEEAEKMLKERGYIRIIVLKGRQEGLSTYIEGRFYWKVTHNKGQQAFILTHEAKATANLFKIAKRYHEYMNPLLKPQTDRDSGNELSFNILDSGYQLGTAGTTDVGRSGTVQYFHGSEVAFWPNAKEHTKGIMQCIPPETGEVWLESTSDGVGNYFYDMWRLAVQGTNDFLPLFVPWFWMSEYIISCDDFDREEEEEQYAKVIQNYHQYDITDEQLNFRRFKIGEFGGDIESFKREYPATPQEAFESAGISQLIPSGLAIEAHAIKDVDPWGALVMGVDCARFGNDRTVIYQRMGRVAKLLGSYEKKDQMEVTGIVKGFLELHSYDRCFIDTGMGVGVIDRLSEMGFDEVQGVDFGGKALDPRKYTNKRNEMYGLAKEWMEDGPVFIDDETDSTLDDLCSVHYKFDSKSRKVLESKDDTKKRLHNSPDAADAFVLTFAEPVAQHNYDDDVDEYQEPTNAMGY